ncbi:MAG TPA: PAS domain S-box protein [Vicinamibacteria bacterium]|nr:PAS domain S-box protein [Vicinamibacteria bacterium]
MGEQTVGILPVLITQVALQAVLALILAGILGAFYRLYRHAYLRHWSLSWLALVVYIGASAVSGLTSGGGGHPWRVPAVLVSLVAGYLQVAWLLLGAWGLARAEDPPARTVRVALGLAMAAGTLSVGLVLARITAPSATGVRCFVAGGAYLVAAAAILVRRRPLARVGSTFAGVALGLYAADQLAYFALGFVPPGRQLGRLPFLMTFDILATAVLGLALVAWLLEGEREKQVHAAELARRRERAQAGAYRISEAARTVWDLPALFRSIHETLGDVLPARNFYIALHDRASGLVSFPYFSDERDTTPAPKPLGRGLTEYVLRTGQPLLATPEVFRSLVARGEVELIASDSVDWLGAPLVARGEVIGVAAVQTYDRAVRLGPEERDLFVFVSGQIAAAIEAKRAEDALRQSETRLRVAIQQVPAVLWTTDEELRFTSSLGAGLAALGLAPNQVVGLSLEQYLGAGSVGLDRHRLALRGESAGYEYEHDGRAFTVHVEALRDAGGAIRGTVGIALDITDGRRADQALRESEARLRQVIDLVPHFIFAKDEEGRFLLANRAVAEAYGTTVDGLMGRTDADFARSEEEARHFREDDLEVIRSGQPRVVLEEPITDARGRVRHLQTTKIPFTFSGTGRPAVLGVSIDISERKAAEETLRRAAKDESLSVLAGGVAHDFNNLLAAILGHASLALKQLPGGSPARRHVEKAASAVERAADLTRQMLAYSGRGHFVVRPTDVNALVSENLPLLEVAVPKRVRLEARLLPGLPPVDADVGQIQQVLMNLVINGAEAIGEQGGAVTVVTGTRDVAASDESLWRASGQPLAPGRYVLLEVRDDGPGMDADTVDRIFEPFFTTKFTGRGLGLAAVLGVVRGHRGALSVESAPGRGTVFRILFAPSSRGSGLEAAAEAVPARRDLTLLLIDDEEVVRDMVGEVLEQEGVSVLRAEDGARGVALFREQRERIDLVLLDLSMPGLSGEETFRRLREIDPGVPVILSSGYDHDEARGRFGKRTPAGFIQKPYRPEQLMAEIGRCLGRTQPGSAS